MERNEEIEGRGGIENQLPIIQEENENDSGAEFFEIGEMVGIRIKTRHNRKQMMKF